nr:hypothetical protein [Gluconobacter oxydans]
MNYRFCPFVFSSGEPDVWDFWFILKTFGPGCIAGLIALMALSVALTQRKIAANKYNLDLFDKRYEIYERLNSFYDSNSSPIILMNYNFSYVSISHELKYILLRASFLFENVSKDELSEINDRLEEIETKFKSLLEERFPIERDINERKNSIDNIKRNHQDEINTQSYSAKRNEVRNHEYCIKNKLQELNNIENQMKKNHEKLINRLSCIVMNMEKELSVPHKPY